MTTISPSNLGRALWLVGRQILPVMSLAITVLGVAYVAYLWEPRMKVRRPALDFVILTEHQRRVRTVPASDIAFVGDSSCSMGVDVPALEAATSLSSEAFCTAIFSGPVGHAEMIDALLARGAAPGRLVIMIHPAQFARKGDWDKRFDEEAAPPDKGYLATALDLLKFEFLSRALFTPLPAGWGQYYGGEGGVKAVLRNQKGSFVDPNRGLGFRSFEEMVAEGTGPAYETQGFDLSETFLDALDRLEDSIVKLGHDRVLLLISPIPESALPPNGRALRQAAAEAVASRLGLTRLQIIETPATYPDVYFSSVMHFNRWGRQPFTMDLGRILTENRTEN